MEQKTIIAIAAIMVIIVGVAYYFGGYKYGSGNPLANTTSGNPSPEGAYKVSIKNFTFDPAVLSIETGDTVTWTNNDSAPHRISGSGFQSENLSNGQSYSFTFNTAGTFDYICSIHPSMKGKIVVR